MLSLSKKQIVLALTLVGIVLLCSCTSPTYNKGRLREIAAQQASAIRLWRIGKAVRDYHAKHGRLPPSVSHDASGRSLLSWRVHLLPFLGQEKLYKRFHLNEPWDSENNAALISKMPDVYDFDPDSRNADVGACLGKTCYLALTGVGTLVSASDATGALPTEQMKGEQIIVVETDEARATIWTKPDDATVAQLSSKATSGVLGRRKGKVLSLLANGWIVLVAPENLGDKVAGKKATVVLKKVIEEPEDSHPNR